MQGSPLVESRRRLHTPLSGRSILMRIDSPVLNDGDQKMPKLLSPHQYFL